MRSIAILFSISLLISADAISQGNQPYTASFIGRMGVDTVLVETYTMINNHLYGKAFIRVPEDYIGEFSIHFHPDGSIREFNVNAMNPVNSSVPYQAKSGAFEYRLNMNCRNDTCTYYNSERGGKAETIFRHATKTVDFVGGWVPFISLMEWNCLRLAKSGKSKIPLKMINHRIGVYDIGVHFSAKDTIIFGGPFLEYTKLNVNQEGRISQVNGIGTPWNYLVTKHPPIDIEPLAKRMAKTPGIGIPSPTETIRATVKQANIELSYGRPYKRGRVIFGGVVPYDSIWRTGAGSPTRLSLDNQIRIGTTVISKGQYSLYSIPQKDKWLLIFSTDLKSWPTDPNRSKDFAQVVIPVKTTTNRSEQFTISIQETAAGGELTFHWDNVLATAAFDVLKK
ncbi:DUF2911 domain-containing protein [Spirosoma sp. BT702]|uniref:DUF2911 domain-containing protein n=1 Tax=Spirosoma profusum TaxID=2771354 RepID=A0A926XZL6_9BACT|nr:DUF2911 domain-containing protein [Spirosoma profusum]MBD2701162.1 DUF2911 domain-containing protein [Spirosoma profusum]